VSVERAAPHSLDAERAVLGSLLIDRDAIIAIAPILKPDDFYDSQHRALFRLIHRLYEKRVPADLVLLSSEPDIEDAGGMVYATELMTEVPTAIHANYYAEIVRDVANRRRFIEAGVEIIATSYDAETVEDVATNAAAALNSAAGRGLDSGLKTMHELVEQAYQRIGQGTERVTPFGLRDLDGLTGGMRDGQLVVIAARTSVGKSALAMQIVHHNAIKKQTPVGMISLEMSGGELTDRLASIEGRVNMHRARAEWASDSDRTAATAALARIDPHVFICDDTSSGSLADIQARARQMVATSNIKFLVIDYLQMMHTGGKRENRVQEVSEISRGLKQIARELRIPVLALAQLSRAAESVSDGIPRLSHLRESGSIEQDADMVIFIHRPDPTKNVAELIVAKHRNGPTDTISVTWLPEYVHFINYSRREVN